MDGIKWFNKVATPKAEPHESEKPSYSMIRDSSDGGESLHIEPGVEITRKRRSRTYQYLIFFTKGAFLTLALLGAFTLGRSTLLKSRKPVSCSCGGTTVDEALSRGCVFSELAFGWLPPQCLDKELSDEFDRQGPLPGGEWPYWADANGTIPLAREELPLLPGDTLVYTTQEWHIVHCMFSWRKLYRSHTTGITVENRANTMPHIRHCQKIMLDPAPLQSIWTEARVELNEDAGK